MQPRLELTLSSKLVPLFNRLGGVAALLARAPLDRLDLAKLVGLGPDDRGDTIALLERIGVKQLSDEDEQIAERVLRSLGLEASQDAYTRTIEAHYLQVGQEVSKAGEIMGLGTDLPDPVARSVIAAGGRRAGLVDLSAQSRAALFRALEQGRAAGEGAGALAQRIGNSIAGGPWTTPQIRARIIARTETKFAQNVSMLGNAAQAGVEHVLVFDGRLPNSDEDCIARDGRVVTREQFEELMMIEHPNGSLSGAPYFGTV